MSSDPNIAMIASLLSEPSRAAILLALMDDRFYTAGELAKKGGVKPQTASYHLSKMVEANIATVEKQGRHRYYRLSGHEVAKILESLLYLAPPVEIKSFNQSVEDKAIRLARTCYDHIAGNLGVKLTEAMLEMEIIKIDHSEIKITEKGNKFFSDLQVDITHIRKKRRSFCHQCLDWTERRFHLGGALGHAILEKLLELGWIQRAEKTRALKITPKGTKGFEEVFHIEFPLGN
ncbi:transcriptional regulator [Heyndrickxia sporothermodurans]|nr:transcriptional regulator [Heyndrickxia sporothermodurans]